MSELPAAAPARQLLRADELNPTDDHRIVLFGAPGTGKTAQILTLPRPIFVYTFEASALATLRGAKDIHILPFFPRRPSDANSVFAKSISKKGETPKSDDDPLSGGHLTDKELGQLYLDFSRDVMQRLAADWWRKEGYQTLALDGLTTLSQHALARTAVLNEKVKSEDKRRDYEGAGFLTSEVFGYLSVQTPIFFTALHSRAMVDDRQRSYMRLELPGMARFRLPTISTVCWRTCVERDENKNPSLRFGAQTFPDREYQWIRPGPFQLPDMIDLTIEDWAHPERFGIGKLIAKQH